MKADVAAQFRNRLELSGLGAKVRLAGSLEGEGRGKRVCEWEEKLGEEERGGFTQEMEPGQVGVAGKGPSF